MKLENWSIVYAGDPYMAPELQKKYLCGEIFDSDKFENGKRVQTSHIVKINKENKTITTKSGSVYELGEVDPEYEKVYPNAKVVLFTDYNHVEERINGK